jgi:hypothetical protein
MSAKLRFKRARIVLGVRYTLLMTNQEHVRLLYQAEKEKNDWIRAYDNAIQGLNYWKAKAMHNHAK